MSLYRIPSARVSSPREGRRSGGFRESEAPGESAYSWPVAVNVKAGRPDTRVMGDRGVDRATVELHSGVADRRHVSDYDH